MGLAGLGTVGAGLLLVGVSGGGTRAEWTDWSVVVPFCLGGGLVGLVSLVGVYCVVVLVWVKGLSVGTVMLYIGGLLHGVMVCLSFSPSLPYVPTTRNTGQDTNTKQLSTHIHLLSFYLSLIRTLTPTQTGLSLAALTITLTLPFGVDAGEKHAHVALWAVRLGWALNVLLTGCFALLDEETPTAGWVFALLGGGLSHVALARGTHVLLLSSSSSPSSSSSCSSCTSTTGSTTSSSSAGGVRAIATHNVLFTWGACAALPVSCAVLMRLVWAGGWDGEVDGDGGGVTGELGMLFRTEGGEILLDHIVEGLGDIWKLWMGIGGMGVVTSLLVR